MLISFFKFNGFWVYKKLLSNINEFLNSLEYVEGIYKICFVSMVCKVCNMYKGYCNVV